MWSITFVTWKCSERNLSSTSISFPLGGVLADGRRPSKTLSNWLASSFSGSFYPWSQYSIDRLISHYLCNFSLHFKCNIISAVLLQNKYILDSRSRMKYPQFRIFSKVIPYKTRGSILLRAVGKSLVLTSCYHETSFQWIIFYLFKRLPSIPIQSSLKTPNWISDWFDFQFSIWLSIVDLRYLRRWQSFIPHYQFVHFNATPRRRCKLCFAVTVFFFQQLIYLCQHFCLF